jgi:hypothetical protein
VSDRCGRFGHRTAKSVGQVLVPGPSLHTFASDERPYHGFASTRHWSGAQTRLIRADIGAETISRTAERIKTLRREIDDQPRSSRTVRGTRDHPRKKF